MVGLPPVVRLGPAAAGVGFAGGSFAALAGGGYDWSAAADWRALAFLFHLIRPMQRRFRDASPTDAPAIAGLQNAAAGALTARFGEGHWSSLITERSAVLGMRHARVRIGRSGKQILTVLRLATKKPWVIDVAYFTAVTRPLYLTGMAVSVGHQGQGLGRLALEDARAVAVAWPADAIRLDAYDADAGAGPFYARCGFRERGRVVYKGVPHRYYECLLP